MELLDLLKNQNFNILDLLTTYKFDQIKLDLDEVVQNTQGYEELKNNIVASNNFFSLVSQIYLIEQNRLQNSVKADADLSISKPFNSKFEAKIIKLSNETSTSNLSR